MMKLITQLVAALVGWVSIVSAQTCSVENCESCLLLDCAWRNGTCVDSCNVTEDLFSEELECYALTGNETVGVVSALCSRIDPLEGTITQVDDNTDEGGLLTGGGQQACSLVGDTCESCLDANCDWSNDQCVESCVVRGEQCLSRAAFPVNSTSAEICGCISDTNQTASDFCDGGLSSLIDGNITSVAPRPTDDNSTLNNETSAPTASPSELIVVDAEEEEVVVEEPEEISPFGNPCETTEQCESDDFFCSSASSTCVHLNCSNWLEGTPPGKLPYGEEPCVKEVDGIENDAGFCSPVDGMCHDYTCEEWYQFGPVAFTGYDPSNPVTLQCEDYDNGESDRMNGIVFGCRPYTPGNKAPEAKTWTSYFNTKCSARPRVGHDFMCYKYKDRTDFRDYLREVARLSPPFCDQSVYGGLTSQPSYWYNVIMEQEREGQEILHKAGRANTTTTNQFDPSEAEKAMYAYLLSDRPPPEQNVPGDGPPQSDSAKMPVKLVLMGVGVIATSMLFWF